MLNSAGIKPNKRFGQHFLIDLNLMKLLVDSINPQRDDIILEVGCGTGSLTEELAKRTGRVVAVEIDSVLAEIAKSRLLGFENVEIINTDILENKHTISNIVIKALHGTSGENSGRFILAANLPYNVASPLMINLLSGPIITDEMYITVQKEVADRMIAAAGGKNYGPLSIFLNATGYVEMIRHLKPDVFWPRPQVDSAMMSFIRDLSKAKKIADMKLFGDIVHLFMGHRRKTLSACSKLAGEKLSSIRSWPEIFKSCSIDPSIRPDNLSPEDYVSITNRLSLELSEND